MSTQINLGDGWVIHVKKELDGYIWIRTWHERPGGGVVGLHATIVPREFIPELVAALQKEIDEEEDSENG